MQLKIELRIQGDFLAEMKSEPIHEGGIRNLQDRKGIRMGMIN